MKQRYVLNPFTGKFDAITDSFTGSDITYTAINSPGRTFTLGVLIRNEGLSSEYYELVAIEILSPSANSWLFGDGTKMLYGDGQEMTYA